MKTAHIKEINGNTFDGLDEIILNNGMVIVIGNGYIGLYNNYEDFAHGENDALHLEPLKTE